MLKYAHMTDRKKIKKTISLVSILIIGIILVVVAGLGLFFYHIKTTKDYCSDYASSRSKALYGSSDDERSSAQYDQCMRDKGLGGF